MKVFIDTVYATERCNLLSFIAIPRVLYHIHFKSTYKNFTFNHILPFYVHKSLSHECKAVYRCVNNTSVSCLVYFHLSLIFSHVLKHQVYGLTEHSVNL